MTKEQLIDFLIDIDYEYFNNINPSDEKVSRRQLKVAITQYQYTAERLREILDNEYQHGYDNCLRNFVNID